MVDLRIISQLVEFILCIFYDAVILTVIPECAEAIAFHFRIATAAYVGVEEQVQSSKTVVDYALLIVVIIGITIIRCGILVEPYLLCQLLCAVSARERNVKGKYERGYRNLNVIGYMDSVGDCSLLRS